MICKNCGEQLIDGSSFCPFCGVEFSADEIVKPQKVEVQKFSKMKNNPNEINVPKVWKVFALVSKIIGIVTLATCWIPIFGFAMLSFSIPGIIFGALSKRGQVNDTVARNRKIGLILCVLSTILSIVFYIILLIIVYVMAVRSYQNAGNIYY